ncbi:MAG: hypothetical protein V1808_03325 [Candidatus Daviesbacteria bacterium]
MMNVDREDFKLSSQEVKNPERRALFANLIKRAPGALAAILVAKELEGLALPEIAEAANLPWGNGKYQTFPRQVDEWENIISFNLIDLGTLGPDVDTIFGLDFKGDIPTGALVLHQPSAEVLETRVVGIKRTNLETVQFRPAIGGDRFDVYRISEYGGDVALDAMARLHAQNTARQHQKVVYIGDLGLFEKQWGTNEKGFLDKIIRAQRPSLAGIIEPDFVNPRTY